MSVPPPAADHIEAASVIFRTFTPTCFSVRSVSPVFKRPEDLWRVIYEAGDTNLDITPSQEISARSKFQSYAPASVCLLTCHASVLRVNATNVPVWTVDYKVAKIKTQNSTKFNFKPVQFVKSESKVVTTLPTEMDVTSVTSGATSNYKAPHSHIVTSEPVRRMCEAYSRKHVESSQKLQGILKDEGRLRHSIVKEESKSVFITKKNINQVPQSEVKYFSKFKKNVYYAIKRISRKKRNQHSSPPRPTQNSEKVETQNSNSSDIRNPQPQTLFRTTVRVQQTQDQHVSNNAVGPLDIYAEAECKYALSKIIDARRAKEEIHAALNHISECKGDKHKCIIATNVLNIYEVNLKTKEECIRLYQAMQTKFPDILYTNDIFASKMPTSGKRIHYLWLRSICKRQ